MLSLDCRLNPASLSPDLPKALRRLEPFGSGNPQPLFGLFGMELREIVPVGGGGHLRLVCQKHGAFVNCMRFGVKPEECLYIGDTATDMQTGNRAGMKTVGVLWGFRSREELEESHAAHIIGKPQELLDLLADT